MSLHGHPDGTDGRCRINHSKSNRYGIESVVILLAYGYAQHLDFSVTSIHQIEFSRTTGSLVGATLRHRTDLLGNG